MNPHPDPNMVKAKKSPQPSPTSTPTPEATGKGHSYVVTTETPRPERTTSVNQGGHFETPSMKSNVVDKLPHSVHSDDTRPERSFF
jgi:hypothetical protein